ncbi:MAG: YtxH domain-containing protein [Muribaculaceae bacterium]|nr:YtxH domain-containing protein [Muribaculaceae bacterium]
MKLDELKQSWKEMNTELKRAESMNAQLRQQLTKANMRPQRERLRHIFARLMIAGFLSPWLVSMSLMKMNLAPEWLCLVLALFFLWAATTNAILYYRVGKIDLNVMSVKEALIGVLDFKKLRCRFKVVNMSVGIPVLIMLLWYCSLKGEGLDYAGLAGGVIGAIIGLLIDRNIRKQIKELEATLRDELKE